MPVFLLFRAREKIIFAFVLGGGNTIANSRDELLINEAIKAPELRVVTEAGEQLGIMSKEAAMQKAFEAEADLILIAPQDPGLQQIQV